MLPPPRSLLRLLAPCFPLLLLHRSLHCVKLLTLDVLPSLDYESLMTGSVHSANASPMPTLTDVQEILIEGPHPSWRQEGRLPRGSPTDSGGQSGSLGSAWQLRWTSHLLEVGAPFTVLASSLLWVMNLTVNTPAECD